MQRDCITFLKSKLTELDALKMLRNFFGENFKITVQKPTPKWWIFLIEGHYVKLKVKRFKDKEIMRKVLKNV